MDEEFDEAEPVELPLEPELDLHSFAPREVREVVTGWLEEVRGVFPLVTIIHGRGIGAQRAMVRKILENTPGVAAFHDSLQGNWGATVVHFESSDDEQA